MPAERGAAQAGPAKTLLVALLVSLACSIVVTSAAVMLRPLQSDNEQLARQRNILAAAGLLSDQRSIEEQFQQVQARVVELATGREVQHIDPADFDPLEAARDPRQSAELPRAEDIAGLGRRAQYGLVYTVQRGGRLRYIILPVRGYGLWSTMHGYLALERDANTIRGLRFHQHGETPGLGARIDDPDWLELWPGKLVYGPNGQPAIEVIRGRVTTADGVARASPRAGDPAFQVDGLAGATLTGRGVTNMLRYWLGDNGYGPYLQNLWKREQR